MKQTRKEKTVISPERTKKCWMKIYADNGKHEALLQKRQGYEKGGLLDENVYSE